jgi:hypothetical protein
MLNERMKVFGCKDLSVVPEAGEEPVDNADEFTDFGVETDFDNMDCDMTGTANAGSRAVAIIFNALVDPGSEDTVAGITAALSDGDRATRLAGAIAVMLHDVRGDLLACLTGAICADTRDLPRDVGQLLGKRPAWRIPLLPALVAALRGSPEYEVRAEMVRTIASFGDAAAGALPALAAAIHDRRATVRAAAQAAIAQIGQALTETVGK